MQYCSLPVPHNFILSPHCYDRCLCYCLQQNKKTIKKNKNYWGAKKEKKKCVTSLPTSVPRSGKSSTKKNSLPFKYVGHKYISSLFTFRGKMRAIHECLGETRVPLRDQFPHGSPKQSDEIFQGRKKTSSTFSVEYMINAAAIQW